MKTSDDEVMPDLGDIPIPGGTIPASSFDVGNNSTTYRTAGQIPPPPPMPIARPAMPMQQPAPAAPPPMARPPAPSLPGMPPPPMPSMSDVLSQAQGAGSQLYGAYTPEKRNELYTMLLDQATKSKGQGIGNALAMAGDAIAGGYGHRDSNFLDKSLQSEKDARQGALDAFDTAQKGKLAETGAGMELEKMDPNSKISQVSRQAYAPLLAKLGYSPAALSKMSAANVETVSKVAADLGGKEMENLFHQAQLIVENNYHKAEIGIQQEGKRAEALKQLGEHPIASMLPTATNAALKQQAGLTAPTTGHLQPGATTQAGGPLGPTTVKDGKTYEWSPITQKYHLKQ